jgi:hypothetical protein
MCGLSENHILHCRLSCVQCQILLLFLRNLSIKRSNYLRLTITGMIIKFCCYPIFHLRSTYWLWCFPWVHLFDDIESLWLSKILRILLSMHLIRRDHNWRRWSAHLHILILTVIKFLISYGLWATLDLNVIASIYLDLFVLIVKL